MLITKFGQRQIQICGKYLARQTVGMRYEDCPPCKVLSTAKCADVLFHVSTDGTSALLSCRTSNLSRSTGVSPPVSRMSLAHACLARRRARSTVVTVPLLQMTTKRQRDAASRERRKNNKRRDVSTRQTLHVETARDVKDQQRRR